MFQILVPTLSMHALCRCFYPCALTFVNYPLEDAVRTIIILTTVFLFFSFVCVGVWGCGDVWGCVCVGSGGGPGGCEGYLGCRGVCVCVFIAVPLS